MQRRQIINGVDLVEDGFNGLDALRVAGVEIDALLEEVDCFPLVRSSHEAVFAGSRREKLHELIPGSPFEIRHGLDAGVIRGNRGAVEPATVRIAIKIGPGINAEIHVSHVDPMTGQHLLRAGRGDRRQSEEGDQETDDEGPAATSHGGFPFVFRATPAACAIVAGTRYRRPTRSCSAVNAVTLRLSIR